jgi:hypothetical protein
VKSIFVHSILVLLISINSEAGVHRKLLIQGKLQAKDENKIIVVDNKNKKWEIPRSLLMPKYPLLIGQPIRLMLESKDILNGRKSSDRIPASN